MSKKELSITEESDTVNDKVVLNKKSGMKLKNKYLKMHPYRIWCGTDGYFRTYLPKGDTRVLVKKKKKEDLEDRVIEYWRDQEKFVSVEDVFDEWNERRLKLEQISAATYSRNNDTFKEFFSDFGKKNIQVLTPLDVETFLEEQVAKHHLTAKAFAQLKTVVRGTFKWAKKRELISFSIDNVISDLDLSSKSFKHNIKDEKAEIFDEDELPVLIDYLTENQDIWNLGILLLLFTGMRVGELVSLKWADFTESSVRIRRTETCYRIPVDGKIVYTYDIKEFPKTEAGVREIIIPQNYLWVVDELREINPDTEYVFMRGGKRMTTNTIRNRLYKICQKFGWQIRSPHKCRKTYASILLDNGVDSKFIESQMGHTDLSCTETYYHRDRKSYDTKKKILNNIPEFSSKKN